MNDTNSIRAHVRRSALRGGNVALTSAQIDALTDELACNGAIISAPPLDHEGCVGVVDGRCIVLVDADASKIGKTGLAADADAASKIGKTGLRVGSSSERPLFMSPHVETARIVIEADTSEATTALKDTAGALDAVTAAANAASAALDNLPKREADGLTFTIDLDANGGLPHVSISGPCELLATHNRLGVEGIVDVAKRAQRALYQAIVDKPEAE